MPTLRSSARFALQLLPSRRLSPSHDNPYRRISTTSQLPTPFQRPSPRPQCLQSSLPQTQRRWGNVNIRRGKRKPNPDFVLPTDKDNRLLTGSNLGVQPSPTVQRMEVAKGLDWDDIGLIPGTLVMPEAEKLPSYRKRPIRRLRMEWERLFKRVKDLASLLSVIKFSEGYRKKHRRAINFKRVATEARSLHEQLYTAIARGDTESLRTIACSGLRNDANAEIGSRPHLTGFVWRLHQHLTPPRVVSHRAVPLPVSDPSRKKPWIRQAVVRIRSLQSLQPVEVDHDGDTLRSLGREAPKEKYDEYVVIQKRFVKGEEEDWKVWGTVEETDVQDWSKTLNPEAPKGPAPRSFAL